jgi:hypothetical protein
MGETARAIPERRGLAPVEAANWLHCPAQHMVMHVKYVKSREILHSKI